MNQPDPGHPKRGKPPRRRTARYALVLLAGVTVICAWSLYYWFTHPARLREVTQAYLQDFFLGDVTVGTVSFDLFEGLQVSSVTVADPQGNREGLPALNCESVHLIHEPLALLWGNLVIREINAERAVCRAVFDPETSRFNLQDVVWMLRGTGAKWHRLPVVDLDYARVVLYSETGGDERHVEDLTLSLLANPVKSTSRVYHINWSARTDRKSSGLARWDIDSGIIQALEGGTPWLQLEAATMVIEAAQPAARRWIELLGIEGLFRTVNYRFCLNDSEDPERTLELEFENASLSTPIDRLEHALPPEDRFIHLTEVTGRVAVRRSGATAVFAGMVNDGTCRVEADFRGEMKPGTRLMDLGFDIAVSVEHVTAPRDDAVRAPAEHRFIHLWPGVAKFYRDFSPSGRGSATIRLHKSAGADAPVQLLSALVRPEQARIQHRLFPYEIREARGQLELNADGYFLHDLHGRHGDALIFANGWVGSNRRDTAVDLFFNAYGISLDGELCEALRASYRPLWNAHDPRGVADLHVHLSRPQGVNNEPERWQTVIHAEPSDVTITPDRFRYPIVLHAGTVLIDGAQFTLQGLSGTAGDAEVTADGVASWVDGRYTALDVAVAVEGAQLDETLASAIRETGRGPASDTDVAGEFDATVQLHLIETTGQIAPAFDAMLADVTVSDPRLPFAVTDVTGNFRLDRQGQLHCDVNGQSAMGGRVAVQGCLGSIHDPQARDYRLHAERIDLAHEIWEIVPPLVAERLAEWNLRGSFGIDLRIAGNDLDPNQLPATVNLAGLQFEHDAFPLAGHIDRGQLMLDSNGARFANVHVTTPAGRVLLGGTLAPHSAAASDGDRGLTGALDFEVHDATLNDVLHEALPWRIRRVWNNLKPYGRFAVRQGTLRYERAAGKVEPTWNIDGQVHFDDAALSGGASLTGAKGQLQARATGQGSLRDLNMTGHLAVQHVDVNGLRVEDLQGRVFRDGPGRRFRFADLTGRLYQGTLAGEIDLVPRDGRTHYDVNLALHRVALSDFLRALNKGKPVSDVTGWVEGKMYLSGPSGEPAERRGGGRVAVSDASLYRLPLLLAILQVVNLSAPETSAFQAAGFEWYLVGDHVDVKDIKLQGGAFDLLGSGSVEWKSRELDLHLVAVSPHRWANVPLFTEMLQGAARELIEVEVHGPANAPKIMARPLRGVEAAMHTLFKSGATAPAQRKEGGTPSRNGTSNDRR